LLGRINSSFAFNDLSTFFNAFTVQVLMGHANLNVFQILLPAVLLHGTFDFVLFLMGVIGAAYDVRASRACMCLCVSVSCVAACACRLVFGVCFVCRLLVLEFNCSFRVV